jgi:hypothetical protein
MVAYAYAAPFPAEVEKLVVTPDVGCSRKNQKRREMRLQSCDERGKSKMKAVRIFQFS